jgi:hypothetical protein
MKLVSQSEFARMCGVSRQAVLKWKTSGMLVVQGKQVDVDATDERMRRYHTGGSPLRACANGAVDTRLTNRPAVDKKSVDLSTEDRDQRGNSSFAELDGTQEFDLSRAGLENRIGTAASILGFDVAIRGDDIDLRRDNASHFLLSGDSFDVHAYCALDQLRWWLNADEGVPEAFLPALPLLAKPFGTIGTAEVCNS